MIRRMVVGGVGGLFLAGAAAVYAQDAALVAKGKTVYETASPKCKVCHAVAGAGNPKGSLDGVGTKLSAEEIKAWHRDAKGMTVKTKSERKPPMPNYPKEKLSDEDLEALTAYLLSLKK